jgi:hypothetical protein
MNQHGRCRHREHLFSTTVAVSRPKEMSLSAAISYAVETLDALGPDSLFQIQQQQQQQLNQTVFSKKMNTSFLLEVYSIPTTRPQAELP